MTFDNLKKYPGVLPEGCWRLELTEALIGNEVVSCLYLCHRYDGYDVIFLNCVEERSKQCENFSWALTLANSSGPMTSLSS